MRRSSCATGRAEPDQAALGRHDDRVAVDEVRPRGGGVAQRQLELGGVPELVVVEERGPVAARVLDARRRSCGRSRVGITTLTRGVGRSVMPGRATARAPPQYEADRTVVVPGALLRSRSMATCLVTGGAGFQGSRETGVAGQHRTPPRRTSSVARATSSSQALPTDDPKIRQPDITLATEILGWAPHIQLREGLQRTIDHSGIGTLVGTA